MTRAIEELHRFLAQQRIDPADACITGGLALSLFGIRPHKDIDILISTRARQQLGAASTLDRWRRQTALTDRIELKTNSFTALGLNDDQIISNPAFCRSIRGCKVIRAELLMAAKMTTGRARDLADIRLLGDFAKTQPDWDWKLVLDTKHRPSFTDRVGIVIVNEGPKRLAAVAARRIGRRIRGLLNAMRGAINAPTSVGTLLRDGALAYPVANLLLRQYERGAFGRYDVIVRLMAAESLLGGKEDGRALYDRMQTAAGKRTEALEGFTELVESVASKGLRDTKRIVIDPHGHLVDGAHRLALALLREERRIAVTLSPRHFRVSYDRAWFERKGFSANEVTAIECRMAELFEREGVYFCAMIWPPAIAACSQVEALIREEHRIVAVRDLDLGAEIADFVRKTYAIDDIDSWKVERKVARIATAGSRVRVFVIEVADPGFRTKHGASGSIAREIEVLKRRVRRAVRQSVRDYIDDVVIHIGDNPDHNRALFELCRRYSEH